MRIGLFTDSYYPEINGVATSCFMLHRELQKRGHEVHVFAPRCKGWEAHREDSVHYIASAPLVMLRDRNMGIPTPRFLVKTRRIPLDVVHTNSEFVLGYLGHHMAARLSCALVHTYHTVWEDYAYYVTHGHADETARKITRRYSKWWCNRFDRIIVPTGKTADLLKKYGVSAPMEIIPSGMDIDRFLPERHDTAERTRLREACGVLPEERVLLYVGRMAQEKNLSQVLRAFALVHGQLPDVRMVLIGEGPMRAHLPELAASLGISGSVNIVGPKPWEEIDRWYAVGDVFCSASHSETQGLTYVEAMAAGLCVCAVNDPCLDGVIEDGVSGVLTGDGDDELAAGLVRAFSAEGREIAANASGYAKPFSASHFAGRVEECYLRAIEDRKRLHPAHSYH